jgi:hypothetical protein
MSELPLTHALVAELCRLTPEEMELPLPVLINLHRTQLRAPLLGALTLADSESKSTRVAMNNITRQLNKQYPALLEGNLFSENEHLQQALDPMEVMTPAAIDHFHQSDALLHEFYLQAIDNWQTHEPLAMLYTLTLPGMAHEVLMEELEAELSLSQQVGQMLCQMAERG